MGGVPLQFKKPWPKLMSPFFILHKGIQNKVIFRYRTAVESNSVLSFILRASKCVIMTKLCYIPVDGMIQPLYVQ